MTENQNKITYLPVGYDDRKKAKELGAQWDGHGWYVPEYAEELFLLKYLRQTKLQRKRQQIYDRIDETERRLRHNQNEDITIPNKDLHDRYKKQLKELYKKQKRTLKKIQNDESLEYYIQLEEANQPKHKKEVTTSNKSFFF